MWSIVLDVRSIGAMKQHLLSQLSGQSDLTEPEYLPPYEQICDEWNPLSVGRDGWLYTKREPHSWTGFWSKTIGKDPSIRSASLNDIILAHCGISKYGQEGGEPDCTFTCGPLPRTSYNPKAGYCTLVCRDRVEKSTASGVWSGILRVYFPRSERWSEV